MDCTVHSRPQLGRAHLLKHFGGVAGVSIDAWLRVALAVALPKHRACQMQAGVITQMRPKNDLEAAAWGLFGSTYEPWHIQLWACPLYSVRARIQAFQGKWR